MKVPPAEEPSVNAKSGENRSGSLRGFEKAAGWTLAALPVLWGLVFLHPELSIGESALNDSVFHLSAARRMSEALANAGLREENPLDCWVDNYSLGYPLWRTYQPLPHLATALLFELAGTFSAPEKLYPLLFYLLLCLLPLCFFYLARAAGLGPLGAGMAAALSVTVSSSGQMDRFGMGYGAYVWRGSGLFTQAWGFGLMLLALGGFLRALDPGASGEESARRAEDGKGDRPLPHARLAPAGLLLALTGLSHLVFGYAALISVALACLVFYRDGGPVLARRIFKALVATGMALLLMGFFLLPLLLDGDWINHSRWEDEWKWNSLGAGAILGELARGSLLDAGRVPLLTLLAGWGAVWAGWRARTDRACRLLLALALFWLLVYFGRHTWGHLLRLILVPEDMHLHRFQAVFQAFAVLLAALAVERIVLTAAAGRSGARLALAIALPAAVLAPLYLERAEYLDQNAEWGRRNLDAYRSEQADLKALMERLAELQVSSPGRVHAGRAAGWGKSFKVGDTPVYSLLTRHGFSTTSFLYHSMSSASDAMVLLDENRVEDYRLFGVRYVVAPAGKELSVGLIPRGRFGRFALLEVPGSGYFDLVSVPHAFTGDRRTVYEPSTAWLRHPLRQAGQHVALYLDRAPPDTYDKILRRWESLPPPLEGERAARGRIVRQWKRSEQYGAEVEVFRACHLLFKGSFHPGLRAWVDGEEAPTKMVTPGFLALPVEPGLHRIRIEYDAGALKPVLLVLGILAFVLVRRAAYTGRLARLEDDFRRTAERAGQKLFAAAGSDPVAAGRRRERALLLCALVVLSLVALRPCLRGLLMAGHDATEYPPRLVEFHENIRNGVFPPLWAPDLGNGHGQPLFQFVPPLFYLTAEIFHLPGASLADSIGLAAFFLGLVAALAMYGIGVELGSRRAGLVMATAYLFSTYFQTDLYVRGNYMEYSALCAFPLALWTLLRAAAKPNASRVLWAALAGAALLLSHNVIALVGLPALLVFALLAAGRSEGGRARAAAACLFSLVASLALAAFHIVPALAEKELVKVSLLQQSDRGGSLPAYFDHFVSFGQLLYSPWGYGISVPGEGDGMSFMLGPVHLALGLAGLLAALRRSGQRSPNRGTALAALCLAAVGALMSTRASGLVWEASETLQYTRYTWRFLFLPSLMLSLLGGLWLVRLDKSPGLAGRLAAAAVVALVLCNISHANPSRFLTFDDEYYSPANIARAGLETTTYVEYEPVTVGKRPPYTPKRLVSLDRAASVRVETVALSPGVQRYRISADRPVKLRLNTFYYPGWKVYVDEAETAVEPEPVSGRMLFETPAGEHAVEARLKPTPLRRAGRGISLVSLLALLSLVLGGLFLRANKRRAGPHA